MKDSEFIELLNLYLDHEITPADSARLEAEVLGDPARREVYREYCRMQKACKVLAQDFQTEAAPAMEGNVVAFEAPRRAARRMGFYVAGGFAAAAACVAFIFTIGGGAGGLSPSASRDVIVQTELPAPANAGLAAGSALRSTERTIGRTVSMPVANAVPPRLVDTLTLAGGQPAEARNSLLTASEQGGAQFEWMRTLELAPVQRVSIEEFRFDGRSPLRRDNRAYASPIRPQGEMEWNAIRYQK